MKKLKVIVWTDRKLTKRERKNFKTEHPGYRLSFQLRYPNFPLIMLVIAAMLVVLKPVLCDMLQELLLQL